MHAYNLLFTMFSNFVRLVHKLESLDEISEVFTTRLCKLLCRSHDNQRAGSFFIQRMSMALQMACVLGTVSDRCVRRSSIHIVFCISQSVYHCSFSKTCFYRSTGLVAGMSSLLVFFVTGLLG